MLARFPARIPVALLLVTSFGVAPACDHAELPAPLPEVSVSEVSPVVETSVASSALRGSIYHETLSPAAGAEVVVTFEGADGAIVREDLVTTNAHGTYEIATLPEGAITMHTYVFVDGALAASRTEPIMTRLPGDGPQMVVGIVLGALALCAAATWASSMDIPGSTDKLRHCVASCRTARWCGLGMGLVAAVLKEILDTACQSGPDWLKKKLHKISQCQGWDAADMAANVAGFGCAPRIWRSCERCCGEKY